MCAQKMTLLDSRILGAHRIQMVGGHIPAFGANISICFGFHPYLHA